MTLLALLVAVIVVGVVVYASTALVAWSRFRGTRVVVCPENHATAAVEVDAGQAAVSAVMGSKDLALQACSRWPEKEDCGQECLGQIEVAPEDTLVTSVLKRWYDDRRCTVCQQPIEFHALEHRPALIDLSRPDHPTIEWTDLDPTLLPDRLKTLAPVCWSCHVAARFRRLHPDLVVDRPSHVGPGERV